MILSRYFFTRHSITFMIYLSCILIMFCSTVYTGPSLKVIGTMSVGYDHVDLTSMKKYGVRLGNTPGVLTEAVAEIAVGLIIVAARRIYEVNDILKM